MSDREASHTALATAYLRAAHQLLDAEPRILDDPMAVRVLGSTAALRIHSAAERYRTAGSKALRSHVVLRSRFAEDRLDAAVRRGVTQYVVLGAGFDTFALRQPEWAGVLQIIEVDHPGTQTLKRSHLAGAGLAWPANAAFAAIDFERESLLDGLRRCHVSLTEPTLFSWLGVTMYLKEAAIGAALRSMASFPAGSEIVLTFLQPETTAATGLSPLAGRVTRVGEPFVSYFEPDAIAAKLIDAGFAEVEFLSPEQARARYFERRPPDLPPPRKCSIVCAVRQEADCSRLDSHRE